MPCCLSALMCDIAMRRCGHVSSAKRIVAPLLTTVSRPFARMEMATMKKSNRFQPLYMHACATRGEREGGRGRESECVCRSSPR